MAAPKPIWVMTGMPMTMECGDGDDHRQAGEDDCRTSGYQRLDRRRQRAPPRLSSDRKRDTMNSA